MGTLFEYSGIILELEELHLLMRQFLTAFTKVIANSTQTTRRDKMYGTQRKYSGRSYFWQTSV